MSNKVDLGNEASAQMTNELLAAARQQNINDYRILHEVEGELVATTFSGTLHQRLEHMQKKLGVDTAVTSSWAVAHWCWKTHRWNIIAGSGDMAAAMNDHLVNVPRPRY